MSPDASQTLSDFLALELDEVAVAAGNEYPIAGVYGFGRGLFARNPIWGSETSYKKLHRLHSGHLVMSRLKAFEGAISVIPEEFEGWFLSPEFPTFRCIEGKLDPEFLGHICRWPEFWSMLASSSKGIGARRERVNAEALLGIAMRIPPINEQRAIAYRLDRLNSVGSELAHRSDRASELTNAFIVSASSRPDLGDRAKANAGWVRISLGEILEPLVNQVQVKPDGRYKIAGIYSFGLGLIDRGEIAGGETSYKSFNVLREDDVVISKLGAWEGAVGVVDADFGGYCVSSEYPTFAFIDGRCRPDFFRGIARSPWFWEALDSNTRGSMARRKRITPTEFLRVQIWLPPKEMQAQVGEWLTVLSTIVKKRKQGQVLRGSFVPAAMNEAFSSL